MVGLDIKINDKAADAALAAKIRACDPHRIATRIAVPISMHWRDALKALPRNSRGFPSSGFWEKAARSVTGVARGGDAVISADHLGLKQRLYGGRITARNVQNITIPICAEAYGTTAKDWGDSLVLVILADGRKFLALWLGTEQAQATYAQHLGKLTKHASTTATRVARFRASTPKDAEKPKVIVFRGSGSGSGAKQVQRAQQHANLKFLFVLKHSVEQAANPAVIPSDMQEFALAQVREAVATP